MAYLDGEMGPRQRARFEAALLRNPQWQAQVEQARMARDAAELLQPRPADPAVWDNYWEEIDSRLTRRTGHWLALAGAAILVLVGFAKILTHTTDPIARFGLILLAAGVAVLFAMVLRGRLIEIPRDRYRRIRR